VKNLRHLSKRIISYLIGLVVMAFGISLAIRADIGVAPGSTIAYAVSKLTPLTIGQCSSLFHVFCMLVQLVITRKPTIKLLFQFPLAYAFGLLIDLFYMLLDFSIPGMVFRVLILLAGLIGFSLGIRIIVGADILLAPPDGLAQTAGRLFGWPMSKSKLAFDITVTVIAALLTLLAAGDAFLVVGVGTVICAIATGPIIGLFTKLFPFFDMKSQSNQL
jgi:uncharacterized membrane protein YczE